MKKMILGEAVTKIANRYGYDAFDNLDEIRDDDLKEAVETVFLARRYDDDIDRKINMLVSQNKSFEYISEYVQLSELCTVKHLYRSKKGRDYLDRCFCTTVPASRLYMLVRDNRISFIKLVLETRCSMSHLKNQLIKYDWGREYLQRHLYEFSMARKGMRT